MPLTRRQMLGQAAALPLLSALPRFATADIAVGGARITTVSDGNLVLPGDFLFETMPQDELADLLATLDVPRDTLTPECNLTLYRDGTNTVLFDVGAGPDFQPSAGLVIDSLAAAGVTPEQVTHVLFTHAHPDHIWGLLDDFDEPTFPNARFYMGRAEWDFWYDPDTVNVIGTARQSFAVGAKRRMEAVESLSDWMNDGDEPLPGIRAVLTPGHTPGHMSYEIGGGGDGALVVGDAIANDHVAFARPEWISGADQDGDLAAETRVRLLDRLAAEQMQIIGFHLPGGGIGRVEKAETGYRFLGQTI